MHRIYFLKQGTHTDSGGEVESYSYKDLKEIKDSYSPKIFTAPIVIGHDDDIKALYENDKAPSYGWVSSLGLDEQGLYADVKLAKELEELLERDVPPYKYVSAAIYERDNPFNPTRGKKKYIRHIAFLGAQPPAIKGLPEVVKMYSESSLFNTIEVFNNNKLIKLEEKKSVMKKYMVDDFDNYEEVVTLPDPETSSPEEVKSFLDENAFDFITYILTEGEYGYPGEITEFENMPSEENNYLFNPKTNSFSGVFYDDTSGEPDGYSFEIKKTGSGWISSYIPVNQEETGEDNFTEDNPPEVAEPIMEEKEEDLFEEEEPLSVQEESSLAQGEIPEEAPMDMEESGEEEEVEEDDFKVEIELMRSESQNLRNEVLRLKNELNEMKMNEYRAYSERFNSLLHGTTIKSEEIASLLFQVEDSSNRRKLTKAYSEVTKEKPVDLLKRILEETSEKLANQGIVAYGEMADMEEETEDMEMEEFGAKPIGAVYSDDGMDMHKKVLAYCSKNGLNPKDASQYLEAYKAVCK